MAEKHLVFTNHSKNPSPSSLKKFKSRAIICSPTMRLAYANCQLSNRCISYQSPYNFYCLIIDHFYKIGCLDTHDHSCSWTHISRDILRISPPIRKNSKFRKFINKCYQQDKHFIYVLYTVNKLARIRMIITLLHGIHQKIFQMVFSAEKVCYCRTASFAIVSATFTSKIMATLLHKLVDS